MCDSHGSRRGVMCLDLRMRGRSPTLSRRTLGHWSMAAVACSALLTAGCGSSTTNTAAAPTKAQYIARADAICHAEVSKKIKEFAAGTSRTNDLGRDTKAAEEANASLRALPQPSGSESVLAEWLKLRERVTAISHGRPASAAEDQEAIAKAYSIARAYGLRSCAESPAERVLGRLDAHQR